MNTKSIVVEYARETHRQTWTRSSDVSTQTKAAISVCQVWQEVVRKHFGQRMVAEHGLGDGKMNEKLDLVDVQDRVAYELKASPNNTHFEFYRDVFKVLVFNQRNPGSPLKTLVFITPEEGARSLRKPFTDEVIKIASVAGIVVEVIGI